MNPNGLKVDYPGNYLCRIRLGERIGTTSFMTVPSYRDADCNVLADKIFIIWSASVVEFSDIYQKYVLISLTTR